MKVFLRVAGALFLRLLIVIALSVVGMQALMEAGSADQRQSHLIAIAIVVVCVGVYYASVKLAGRHFGIVRDSVIVIVILACAWFAIANMTLATSRSNVRRTMADMHTLSTAIEAYSTDYNTYPQAKSLDELAKHLEPAYVRQMPRKDAWKFPLRYEVVGSGKQAQYYIGSSGYGGEWEKPHLTDYAKRINKSKSDDIVLHNGEFIASPFGQ